MLKEGGLKEGKSSYTNFKSESRTKESVLIFFS